MTNEFLINDIRTIKDFKKISFSGYEKSKVVKQLLLNLSSNQIEHACNWTVELIASGHFKDLWEAIILYMSKYIHIASPKLPIYISLRMKDFRDIIKNGYVNNELELRNNSNIRQLFSELVYILCSAPKKHTFDLLKINKLQDFSMENIQSKLKAPSIKYLEHIYKRGDPQELFIAINELCFHITSKNSYNSTYWVEWIIEFDNVCNKNKHPCICERRAWATVDAKFQKNSIWIIWEIIKNEAKKSQVKEKIILALLDIFSLRFTPGLIKRRKYIIYNAINILTEKIDLNVSVINDIKKVENIKGKINLIYKEIKKNEKTPATDYLFNIDAVTNIEKTREKLEIMNKIFEIK